MASISKIGRSMTNQEKKGRKCFRFVILLVLTGCIFFPMAGFGSPMQQNEGYGIQAFDLDAFSIQVSSADSPAADMAELYLKKGQFKTAQVFAQKAVQKNSKNIKSNAVSGVLLAFGGQKQSAEKALTMIRKNPDEVFYTHLIESIICAQDGRMQEAKDHLAISLNAQPDHPFALYYRGSLFLAQNEYEKAVSHYEKTLGFEKNFAPAEAGLGQARLKLDQNEKAMFHYEKAVALEPDNLIYRGQLLGLYKALGKNRLAEQQTKEILYFTPGVKTAYLSKGRELLMMGAYAEAVVLMDKIIPVYKQIPPAFYIKAAAQINLGDIHEAKKNIQKFLYGQNNNPMALHLAGMSYLAIGDHDQAEKSFLRVISLNPNFGKSFIPLTIIEQLRGNLTQALSGLDLAKQMGEPDALMDYLWAHIAYQEKNVSELTEKMRSAARLVPGLEMGPDILILQGKDRVAFSNNRNLMAIFFYNGWYGKTIETGKILLKINDKDPFALYFKAMCEVAQHRTQDAIASYEALLKSHGSVYVAHMGLGRIYLETNKTEKAMASFLRAVDINPGFGPAYLLLGDLHFKEHRTQEALTSYEKAVENGIEGAKVYPKIILLLTQDEVDSSMLATYCEKLEALDPKDPYALDALGWGFFNRRNKEKGLELIRQAQKLAPQDPVILYHLGYACYEQNNMKEAELFLKASLEAPSVFPGRNHAQKMLEILNQGR